MFKFSAMVCSQFIKNNMSMIQYCLQLFQHYKKEFLYKYGTMDETWIPHFTSESKWTAADESCPKWQKMQTSAGKVLASIFSDAQGILFIDYLEKGRTINSKYYIALLVCLKEEIAKKQPQMKKEKVLFHKSNAMSQVDRNDGKTTWIAFWIAATLTLSSRSDLQWLLAVCRFQKNAPEKEIWLQWSDIRNWSVFWDKRQIVLQKKDGIVREALESVYHPRRRLLMNKVKFCLRVVSLVRPGSYWVMCYFL